MSCRANSSSTCRRSMPGAEQHVVEVRIVPAAGGHDWAAQYLLRFQRLEQLVITPPACQTRLRNAIGFLELRPEEGGDQLARQERRTDFLPGVLIDLAPEETAAVRAFLADDLGPCDQLGVVHQQRPALAGDQVLGFVEAIGAKVADAAQRAPL